MNLGLEVHSLGYLPPCGSVPVFCRLLLSQSKRLCSVGMGGVCTAWLCSYALKARCHRRNMQHHGAAAQPPATQTCCVPSMLQSMFAAQVVSCHTRCVLRYFAGERMCAGVQQVLQQAMWAAIIWLMAAVCQQALTNTLGPHSTLSRL